jgi:hypothetical protein
MGRIHQQEEERQRVHSKTGKRSLTAFDDFADAHLSTSSSETARTNLFDTSNFRHWIVWDEKRQKKPNGTSNGQEVLKKEVPVNKGTTSLDLQPCITEILASNHQLFDIATKMGLSNLEELVEVLEGMETSLDIDADTDGRDELITFANAGIISALETAMYQGLTSINALDKFIESKMWEERPQNQVKEEISSNKPIEQYEKITPVSMEDVEYGAGARCVTLAMENPDHLVEIKAYARWVKDGEVFYSESKNRKYIPSLSESNGRSELTVAIPPEAPSDFKIIVDTTSIDSKKFRLRVFSSSSFATQPETK